LNGDHRLRGGSAGAGSAAASGWSSGWSGAGVSRSESTAWTASSHAISGPLEVRTSPRLAARRSSLMRAFSLRLASRFRFENVDRAVDIRLLEVVCGGTLRGPPGAHHERMDRGPC